MGGLLTGQVDCWLAFLDMWGFSADVRGRDAKEIITVLEDIRNRLASRRRDLSWYYMFSDSVVLVQATDTGQAGWNAFVAAIAEAQTCAIDHGFTFRGAITVGPMHCAENICFGVPFLHAYSLEQTLAVPLIVMPDATMRATRFRLGAVADVPVKGTPGDTLRAGFITVRLETLHRLAERRREETVDIPSVSGTWRRLQAFVEPYLAGLT